MSYKLGWRSRKNLEGVDDGLVSVVEHAIQITEQDFSVFEGLRSQKRQRQLYREGKSMTMNSKHLIGQAVDLVPYVSGKLSWDWERIFIMAEAMRLSAIDQSYPVEWGGAWLIPLHLTNTGVRQLQDEYIKMRERGGNTYFLDGAHFEVW